MKSLILLALVAVSCLSGCTTGGYYYGTSYGYYDRPAYSNSSYSFSYNSGAACRPRNQYMRPYQYQQPYVVGPQYYRLERPVCGPIINHMNAPVIAPACNGRNQIIPRSWN